MGSFDQTIFDHGALNAEVAEFARTQIAVREGLGEQHDFPADLWAAMGEAGLMAIGLPEQYGGRGGDYRALAMALETLADVGGYQGVAISWMGQALNARLHILGLGTEAQKQQYLPGMALGRHTACMAISEPGAGAHPKKLSTRAEFVGDDVILNGEKAYLTNGPLADLFLVLAITDEVDGRRSFSTFMVPKESEGLEITPGVEVDFLHPSPHCGLKLTNVRIPAANRLGPLGDAFNAISLPMRRVEDALGAAKTAGAMRHRFRLLCRAAAEKPLDADIELTLGRLVAMPEALSAIALRAADLLDSGRDDVDETLSLLAAAARETAKKVEWEVEAFINTWDIEMSDALSIANRDLVKSLGIAATARDLQARKRGQTLLSG
ncbi:MAG: acyl-CoA dehydrogenase [Rhodospirillaceae bacterium]|jgi:acyl-CoA dehydrogenase|nr:acyl-CoA dehydrogenase [Rhodospirillaceae bacterium]MBT3495493.1 acyl-CoA dehydrogenase [Rhodospirillaceae bacterium]MBT3780077.1 acyl-CoA dehydrogenase [Rhodospirillaceae bacterium]MBT3975464.1 acyl-CoA dehydrogenase [Rhodospirillaceae bacterium]MBT4170804.1 acyl-CoA dehydrogenase [Rhodospirillaceae bacterium]